MSSELEFKDWCRRKAIRTRRKLPKVFNEYDRLRQLLNQTPTRKERSEISEQLGQLEDDAYWLLREIFAGYSGWDHHRPYPPAEKKIVDIGPEDLYPSHKAHR